MLYSYNRLTAASVTLLASIVTVPGACYVSIATHSCHSHDATSLPCPLHFRLCTVKAWIHLNRSAMMVTFEATEATKSNLEHRYWTY